VVPGPKLVPLELTTDERRALAEPGVVPLNRWRPPEIAAAGGPDLPAYCGVGRKP
jgi:hypothetical protein